jgi:hypothetical protein
MPIGASIAMIYPVCCLDRYPYLGYHLLQEKMRKNIKMRGLETSFIYKMYNKAGTSFVGSIKRECLWE